MAKKADEEELPQASESLRQLARLSALWRGSDFSHGLNPVQWDVLRYLQSANRFSRTAGALTKYLGATKGTLSQTLSSLTAKGLVEKQTRADDQRIADLMLTEKARTILSQDPRAHAASRVQELKPKLQKRLAQALDALVQTESQRLETSVFGTCRDCTYHRESGRGEEARCMRFEAVLQGEDENLVCVEHQPR